MTFVLQPKPTFKAAVMIPIPGGTEGKITFEFNRLGKKALKALFESISSVDGDREDADVLSELICGWSGVDQEFSKANLETLCDMYPGSVTAILTTYNREVMEAKTKN